MACRDLADIGLEGWICHPRFTGLGEATDAWCEGCRASRRHWLHVTVDPWYDPALSWWCDTCGRSRQSPGWSRRRGEPLLWKSAMALTIDAVKVEAAA